ALALAVRVPNQRHRKPVQPRDGGIGGAVVDHDHPRAVLQRLLDHFADAQLLVVGRHQHEDVLAVHAGTSTRSRCPGAACSSTLPAPPRTSSSSSGNSGAMALPPSRRCSAESGACASPCSSFSRNSGAPGRWVDSEAGASTSAAPSSPVLSDTSASGPAEAAS